MESLSAESSFPCSEQEVKAELERLLASREFSHAGRLSRFLRFVVERTLAGDRNSLKESVIGTAVYDRTPGYDPKAEPIVRTEARRLRAKLGDYYRNSGRDAAIEVSIPIGGYAAVFRRLPAPAGPRLTVLPKPEAEPVELRPAEPQGVVSPGVPIPPLRKLRYGWRLAAIVPVLAAAGWLVAWRLGDRPVRSEFVMTTVTSYPGAQITPSISPDGRQVAFAWSENGSPNTDLYVVAADGGAPRRLTTAHAADRFPAWSHDGTQIGFIRGNTLMVVSLSGGGERELGQAFPSWLSWVPEANVLLVTDWVPNRRVLGLFAVDETSGVRRQITFPPTGVTGDTAGALSPDGKRLAFIRCTLGNCDIYTSEYGRTDAHRLTNDECAFSGLTWMPDGRSIVYSSRRRGPYMLWQVSASGGAPQQVASSGDDARGPRAGRSPTGKVRLVFYYSVKNGTIWRQPLNPDGAGSGKPAPPERITASTRLDSSPQVSPDGKRIVFASDRTGYDEIWLSDADGANARALTHAREEAGSPRWSPDGNRIAFDLMAKNGRAVFLTDINGAPPQQWTAWGDAARPSWSRDGRWIYFGASDPNGRSQIWKISTAPDRTIQQVTHDGGFEAYESLDGADLFYTRGGGELWRMPVGGDAGTRVTTQPVRPGWWSLARGGIYFADLPEPKADLYDNPFAALLLDPQSGQTRQVASVKGRINRSTPDFAISPDGRTLFFCILEVSTSQIRMLEAL